MNTPDDMVEGYRDGFKADSPEPSSNRTHCYRHGFVVGRSDLARKPAFGGTSNGLREASIAVAKDEIFISRMFDPLTKHWFEKDNGF